MKRVLPAVVACIAIVSCGGGRTSEADQDRAVSEAMHAYQEAKARGVDLERGPCIAEHLPGLPDWVADIAHDPRQPVDDDPTNQCSRYREQEAHHFVELDPRGNLIRAE